MILLKLSFRNIFRNFRRSLLTFLGIAIVVCLSILMVGFSLGIEGQSIRLSAETRTGHVKIHGLGYSDEEEDLTLPLDFTIADYPDVIETIGNVRSVRSAAEKIVFSVSLTDGIDELRMSGAGINPESEQTAFKLADYIIEGDYLNRGEERILLGDAVAELFNAEPGDYMTIIARTKYGAITALDVEIAGVVHVNNPEIDSNFLFMPLDVAQVILEMENEVTEIAVFGRSMEDAGNLSSALSEQLNSDLYEVVTWEYMSKDLIRLFQLRAKARQIMYFVLVLMASASIMNTMLMSVFERINEIGTLMAFGFHRRSILWLFALEGIFLGAIGSIIGCIVGGSVTYYLKIKGLSLSVFGQVGFDNLPFGSRIYAEIDHVMLLAFLAIGITVAFLSALYPAWKGAHLEPYEALRSI